MLGKLKKRKRLRKHGFLSRTMSVLKKRRAKGRKSLTVSINSKYLPHEVVERARSQIGKPYGWFSQNCEHFVNEIQLGVPKSTQALVGGSLLALVLYRLVSSK